MVARSPASVGFAARSWCRADLAGGTLDIWPIGLLHPGSRTVNVALDLAVEVEMERTEGVFRICQDGAAVEATSALELAGLQDGALVGLIAVELELPPIEVRIRSASPRGGGIGGSSALAVAAIAAAEALKGDVPSTPEERSALARDLEARLMELPTGRQDHYPALMGGVLEVRHEPGRERVRRLAVDHAILGRCLMVVYTGQSHFSAGNNWRVIQRRLEGDAETIRCFDGIRDVAVELVEALQQHRLARVGELMSQEWSWRRRLAEGISTPRIEELLTTAQAAGAWGGKVCGAGGGGCLVLLGPPERRREIARALAEAGGEVLPTAPVEEPLTVRPL